MIWKNFLQALALLLSKPLAYNSAKASVVRFSNIPAKLFANAAAQLPYFSISLTVPFAWNFNWTRVRAK